MILRPPVSAGDKLIMPRNVHRSAINALVVNGAIPVYVDPGEQKDLGIPLGMAVEDVEKAILANPDAKAVLVNNPTYYGVCADIRKIAKLAHDHGMLLLADEAHGTHFYFGENLPCSAMAAGADMAAVSIHKTGGSLTQSAMLLCADYSQCRLCAAGHQPDTNNECLLLTDGIAGHCTPEFSIERAGRCSIKRCSSSTMPVRKSTGWAAIMPTVQSFATAILFYAFDTTKLSIHTRNTGLAGIEVYDLLRDEYDIQIEFGDIGNILAIVTAGDRELEIERLISALSEIKRLYGGDPTGMLNSEYIPPDVALPPQQAFFAEKEAVPLRFSIGRVCAEFVMCYPPGIPISHRANASPKQLFLIFCMQRKRAVR